MFSIATPGRSQGLCQILLIPLLLLVVSRHNRLLLLLANRPFDFMQAYMRSTHAKGKKVGGTDMLKTHWECILHVRHYVIVGLARGGAAFSLTSALFKLRMSFESKQA